MQGLAVGFAPDLALFDNEHRALTDDERGSSNIVSLFGLGV